MHIMFRFIRGAALGFELTPAAGVYLHLYLGIAEMMFVDREFYNSFEDN
jgi:hypothetical protein